MQYKYMRMEWSRLNLTRSVTATCPLTWSSFISACHTHPPLLPEFSAGSIFYPWCSVDSNGYSMCADCQASLLEIICRSRPFWGRNLPQIKCHRKVMCIFPPTRSSGAMVGICSFLLSLRGHCLLDFPGSNMIVGALCLLHGLLIITLLSVCTPHFTNMIWTR